MPAEWNNREAENAFFNNQFETSKHFLAGRSAKFLFSINVWAFKMSNFLVFHLTLT